MVSKKNLLIVAGTGQNCGKTTLTEKVIEKISKQQKITALKIAPHYYNQDHLPENNHTEKIHILKENDRSGKKDSSRMLLAGASEVFYIEAKDEHLKYGIKNIIELIPHNEAVICESGSLVNYITPGLFVMMQHEDPENRKTRHSSIINKVDAFCFFNGDCIEKFVENLRFTNGQWKLNKHCDE